MNKEKKICRKAVVLAAGFGTRLRPFTCVTPKPLMPVWGESMISRIVALLREAGVEEIVVNCHYLHEQIEVWCQACGCRAQYEPEILGTGGVLNPLREWIGEDDFYLVNGDIVVDLPDGLERLSAAKLGGQTLAAALVTEEGPRTIEVEPESGFVTNWKSDDAGFDGTFTYCGIAKLSAEVLKYVEEKGFSSIIAAYEKALWDGKFVKAVVDEEMRWTDAGTIKSYVELNQDKEDNAFADFPQLAEVCEVAKPIEFLGSRGSDRVFFRNGDKIVILYDDAKRVENARYAGHAKWLKAHGVSVPEVLADRPELKTLVLADAGTEKTLTLRDYVHVIEALAAFNALGEKAAAELALEPAFDENLYEWERDLFAEHCLGTRYHRTMSEAVKSDLEKVAAVLVKEPKALVHRDFQSTNILWRNEVFTFIDFQGMRLGAAAYDLASLVYDPYVEGEIERRALSKVYARASGREQIVEVLPFAAVQRLVQCLGAYGRLASVGQPQFGKFVLPALKNLHAAAAEANLKAIAQLAEELIGVEKPDAAHHHHHHHGKCKMEDVK